MTTSPAFEARRPHFEEIFAALEKKGIARGELQIAWDYTTASRESNTAALIAMRDDALSVVGAMGPEYTITKTEIDPNPFIAKRLTGMMKVPLLNKFLQRASQAALERQNPELASAVKKLERSGVAKDPQRAQQAMSRLTAAERQAYIADLGKRGGLSVRVLNIMDHPA